MRRISSIFKVILPFVFSFTILYDLITPPNVEANQDTLTNENTVTKKNSTALTIEAAVQEGMTRSPQIQKGRAQAEEASWKRAEIFGSGFLPKLSINGSKYLANQYSVSIIPGLGNFPGFYPNTTLSADLSIPIFDGFANLANVKAAQLNEEASLKEFHYNEFLVTKQIQLAFLQALAAEELASVSQENIKTLEGHLNQVKLQNQGGSATQYDVLRVEVQLSDAKADAIDTEDAVTLSRKKLTQLIGLESDTRGIHGELPIPIAIKVKDLKESDIAATRDDIQALDLRTDASRNSHWAQDSWFFPTVSVAGQYLLYDQQRVNFTNSTVSNTGDFKGAYNVAIFLKWNLFDGGASIARANQSNYQQIIAQKNAEISKIAVPYDFDYWKRRYLSNTDHFLSKTFDISRSEESVRLAREEERAGTRTSTETLDAELDLFRAKAGAINAQVNAAEAQIRLEIVLGRSI